MKRPITIPALIVLLALFAAAPPDQAAPDPAPYERITARSDWTDAHGRRLAFCILGRSGEDRGRTLAVYEMTAGGWSRRFLDLDRGFHPYCIMTAELDGDALPEVAVGAYKSTRFDPKPGNRLFIFDWTGDALFAKWLGSRLGLPFERFAFWRGDDGIDRLLAVEHSGSARLVLRQYHWDGFGFSHDRDWIRVSNPADYEKARDQLYEKMQELQDKGVGP
ncbi:MAG TPA: hypothetical protein VM658_03685 [bacterium]|nr:hypothetical protein [bacterium]